VRNPTDVNLPKKIMRILISGASGLIGNELVKALQQAGHQIAVLTTRSKSPSFSSSVSVFQWNPEMQYIDKDALVDVDVIINLAGAKIAQRWTSKAKKAILNSRTQGTRLLKNTLITEKRHRVTHFISASAIGIYPSSLSETYNENHTNFANGFAGEVVQEWEKEVDMMKSTVKNVSKIRIGLVLAKQGGALPPLAIPTSFGFGAWFGNGKQWQSWIHIQDLVRLFVFTLENPGCYNGVSPNAVSQRIMIKTIAKSYRIPQWLPGIPKFLLKMIIGNMASIMFDSIHASSEFVQTKGFQFLYPSLSDALTDLLPLRNKN